MVWLLGNHPVMQNKQRVTSSFKTMILMKTEIFNVFKEQALSVEARSWDLSLRNTVLPIPQFPGRSRFRCPAARPVVGSAIALSSWREERWPQT